VRLPEGSGAAFLLVVSWRCPGGQPLLLVRPQGRRRGRTALWFARAYRRRWGVEDATRGGKQSFHLERFLVLGTCRDEQHQVELIGRFQAEGLVRKALL
jgi:hypothetical protein